MSQFHLVLTVLTFYRRRSISKTFCRFYQITPVKVMKSGVRHEARKNTVFSFDFYFPVENPFVFLAADSVAAEHPVAREIHSRDATAVILVSLGVWLRFPASRALKTQTRQTLQSCRRWAAVIRQPANPCNK